MNDVHTQLGQRVRQLRLERGWTQETLGERASLSYKFIGEVERGSGNPTVDSVGQIARALGVEISALFARETPTVHYPPLEPRDIAIMRDARASLQSLEQLMTRLNGAPKRRTRKRRSR